MQSNNYKLQIPKKFQGQEVDNFCHLRLMQGQALGVQLGALAPDAAFRAQHAITTPTDFINMDAWKEEVLNKLRSNSQVTIHPTNEDGTPAYSFFPKDPYLRSVVEPFWRGVVANVLTAQVFEFEMGYGPCKIEDAISMMLKVLCCKWPDVTLDNIYIMAIHMTKADKEGRRLYFPEVEIRGKDNV